MFPQVTDQMDINVAYFCAAGTAGLRAKMGPGFNRMNPVTIQQTTQGLLRYLQKQAPRQLADNGVIIGRQCRVCQAQFSRSFASKQGTCSS